MSEEIFRQKSLEKIKSPENLDDYIQVANPGVWLLLISVIILLAGAVVWGIFGHIDSAVDATVRAESGLLVCTVAEESVSSVQEGMTVSFGEYAAVINEIRREGESYVCSLSSGQSIPDGFYDGRIVIGSIKPLSFILN